MKGANTSHNGIVSVAQITNDDYNYTLYCEKGGNAIYIKAWYFIEAVSMKEKYLVCKVVLMKLKAHYKGINSIYISLYAYIIYIYIVYLPI